MPPRKKITEEEKKRRRREQLSGIKRTCDQTVATGSDISDFNSLLTCVKSKCKGIEAIGIDDSHVAEIEEIVASNTIRPFKGTLKIHQISWSKNQPNILHARRLSCIVCAAHTKCSHYEIGQIKVETDLLGSPSKEPSSPHSASMPITLSSIPFSRMRTPTASTDTALSNSPISEGSIENLSPVASRKRLHFDDVYSDDSDDFVVPLHRTKRLINSDDFNVSDSSNENIF